MKEYINKKIYIAGHRGMVGSAIHRELINGGYQNIITRELSELDLIRQEEVEKFFRTEKPEVVIIAAAKVGGIQANNIYRAQFIYENLMIESNLIHCAYMNGVEKLIFLGSSCIYPKLAPQPLKEEYLLSGYLEYTNEPYAIAKIAGIKLCENYYKQYGCNFLSVMPTNLFGINDNFNPLTSHVLPALIRKVYEAKVNKSSKIHIWGSGKPMREFLYVDDLANCIRFILENVDAAKMYESGITHLNIGSGEDISIYDLAKLVCTTLEYEGTIVTDLSKPDGTPRKLLDVSRIHELGWKHKETLESGIRKTYKWYIENLNP